MSKLWSWAESQSWRHTLSIARENHGWESRHNFSVSNLLSDCRRDILARGSSRLKAAPGQHGWHLRLTRDHRRCRWLERVFLVCDCECHKRQLGAKNGRSRCVLFDLSEHADCHRSCSSASTVSIEHCMGLAMVEHWLMNYAFLSSRISLTGNGVTTLRTRHVNTAHYYNLFNCKRSHTLYR